MKRLKHGGSRRAIGLTAIVIAVASSPHAPIGHVEGARPLVGEECENTVQGKSRVADDRGYVCPHWEVKPRTRCCAESSPRFICRQCQDSGCCEDLEFCVSCCLGRATQNASIYQELMRDFRGRGQSSGTWPTVFQACLGRCRHNSQSTVHENAYQSQSHHCFIVATVSKALPELGQRPVSEPIRAPSIDNLQDSIAQSNATVAAVGQDCASVCGLRGKQCDVRGLTHLNNCKTLRQFFPCQDCIKSAGSDQPAYVDPSAPVDALPGKCLVNTKAKLVSCSGRHAFTHRLCPCV